MNRFSRRRLGIVAGGTAAALGVGTTDAAASGGRKAPRPTEVRFNLPPGGTNPSIANGVAVGSMVAVYTSSGLGPAAANPSAPAGSPEQYVDLSLFPGGKLPAGVTVTEAQAWNTLTRIVDNLTTVGLRPRDVITMKCYLKRPAGASDADYAGWNRAYRQFFANVDLGTGAPIPVPTGTGAAAPAKILNPARPARATLEVAGLAVPGWLIEVEVQATYH
ncbi:Rid family hydrolase [Kibdelosporangium aridum]|uniref:Endoribonuclease L-PSP n=1 Tax=Kibdelosporangium aridum TaxID=2030 RepID=A0A1Y5Y833_KIBAR|nr:Rid family hydrolase [Kibdelosporangium aridum]SMD26973.1 Endoribonuclease L-PSP [Kibdelosporangium aridum]